MTKIIAAIIIGLTYSTSFGQHSAYNRIANHYTKTQNFSGAILVAKPGHPTYLHYAGLASKELQVPVTKTTKFKICSITKTFTVAMLLKLAEEGKLKLDATIGTYFPGYIGEGKDKVNLHQLITYSSGIPDCEGNTGLAVYQTEIARDSFINRYCSGALATTPGSTFKYENGGYIILGKIIELATGKSYAENLHTMILEPLGMKNTGFIADRRLVKELAQAYLYNDSTKSFTNDPPYYIENYHASAAMYSTVEDLLKFDQALFNYKLLSKATIGLMLTSYPKLWSVAYGFWVTENKYGNIKARAADRQGAMTGSNTSWLHLVDQNITVIIFSNTNATPINELREKLTLAALNQPYELPKHKSLGP
ncbi:class A beta-lactamase-related serine hydrolase [Segetibacter sp. 3557_3]|uniref:serine hydrolase domain-containing protein n=1 Tax=Segetibacter sp. 3557_3 TaxID=2547429 RepID=UPI001058CFC2|nr:serine hydrolase domain-containing protein [Segetibacter sp. 3557_3]TDH23528.1 class A beta-lactamase-related serine hydrolase [Segetibacter sp. 3557_3]